MVWVLRRWCCSQDQGGERGPRAEGLSDVWGEHCAQPRTWPSRCRRLCSLLLNVYSFCGSAAARSGYESASKDFDPDDLEVQVPGRAFMVTGGNSGIGKATAMEIAKRGEQPAPSCVCWAPRAACGWSTPGRGPCATRGSGAPQPAQAGALDRDPVLIGTAAGFLVFSRSVMSDPLRPHGLQHARLPCLSLSPGACSKSCQQSR